MSVRGARSGSSSSNLPGARIEAGLNENGEFRSRFGDIDQGPDVVSIPGNHYRSNPALKKMVEIYATITDTGITVKSNNVGGAGNATIGLFNQDVMINEDDNGSGAGSITYEFSDGFEGRVISQMIRGCRNGFGLECFGVQAGMRNFTTEADFNGFSVLNPKFKHADGENGSQDIKLNLKAGRTAKDTDKTVKVASVYTNISGLTQLVYTQAKDTIVDWLFYFTPEYDS
jgi:hypothetical protein